MSLDLTVYICRHVSELERHHGHTQCIICWDRLRFVTDSILFEKIKMIPSEPLPKGVKLGVPHDSNRVAAEKRDAWGDPLCFITVRALRRLRIPGDAYDQNKRIITYLRTLDPDTRVVLYWD